MLPKRPTLTFLSASILLAAGSLHAAPAPFDPEAHFPRDTLYYVSVDVGKLREAFGKTPLGAVALHPGVRQALGSLPDLLMAQLRRATRDFEHETGMSLLEFLDLFAGECALTMPSVDTRQGPRMFMSFELGTGTRRTKALEFMTRLGQTAVGTRGTIQEETIRGHKVTRWEAQWNPPMWHTVLGSHLVFSVGESPAGVIGRYEDGGRGDSLRVNSLLRQAKKTTSGFVPLITVFVNVESTRKAMFDAFNEIPAQFSPEAETRAVLEMTGLDKASAAIYQMGIRDGDWEGAFSVESPGGQSGFLKLFADSVSGPQTLAPLAMVPADASNVACFSVNTGRLVRGILDGIQKGVPESSEELSAATKAFEDMTGLSVADDLVCLPRLNCYGFQIFPPSGGILPDNVMLCKLSEIAPYLEVLDTLARRAGAAPEQLEVAGGRTVAYLRVGGLIRQLAGSGAGGPGGSVAQALVVRGRIDAAVLALDPAFSLAFAQLDDEWLVIATAPQAVERYFESYAEGDKLPDSPETIKLIEEKIGSGSAFVLLRGGKGFLAAYNSVTSVLNLAAPHVDPFLKQYGIEPAMLPAGEQFAPLFQDGFLLMRGRSDSIIVRGHRVLTNVIGSVLPEVVTTVAAVLFTVEELQRVARHGHLGEERLKALGEMLKQYPEATGERAFPYDPAGSLASFQKLADSGLLTDSSLLVHPLSADRPASPSPEGKLRLLESHVSYVLVPWKQGPRDSASRMLCYEKEPFIQGRRHVLFVDLSVKSFPEAEFQGLLEEQTRRYGKK